MRLFSLFVFGSIIDYLLYALLLPATDHLTWKSVFLNTPQRDGRSFQKGFIHCPDLAHFSSTWESRSFWKGSLFEMPWAEYRIQRLLQQLVSVGGLALIPCHRYAVLRVYSFTPTCFMHFPGTVYSWRFLSWGQSQSGRYLSHGSFHLVAKGTLLQRCHILSFSSLVWFSGPFGVCLHLLEGWGKLNNT